MKTKLKHYILFLMFTCIVSFTINGTVEATTFPSKITNIYELRDEGSLSGYTGSKRIVGSNASKYGYYLGTQTQFLPYKVGQVTVDTNSAVTSYEYALYCTMFGKSSPALNSYLVQIGTNVAPSGGCTVDNSWDIGIQAGVAAIIDYANANKFSGNSLQKYYDVEIAINQFLYEKLGDACNIDSSQCVTTSNVNTNKITTYNQNLVNLAKDAYALAKSKDDNELLVSFPSTKKLVYNESEEVWKNTDGEKVRIQNLKYLDNYNGSNINNLVKVILKDANNKEYAGYAYLTYIEIVDQEKNIVDYQIGVCNNNNSDHDYCSQIVNFEPLKPGTYTVSIVIEGTKTYTVAQNYSCGTSYQGVTPAFTNTKKVTIPVKSATYTLTVEEPEKITGKIKISKLDSVTKEGVAGAKMKIESQDGSYSKVVMMSKSYETFSHLPLGVYIITEVAAPTDYELTKATKSVTLTEDDTYKEIIFYNTKHESEVSILKVDASDKTKVLEGAKLHIVDEEGKEVVAPWITTKEAYAIMGLGVGKYYIEEIEAPKGYSLNKNKQVFEIKSNSEKKEIKFANNPIAEVPDTMSNTSKILIMLAVIGILTGGVFIYKSKFSEDGRI